MGYAASGGRPCCCKPRIMRQTKSSPEASGEEPTALHRGLVVDRNYIDDTPLSGIN